MGEVHLLAVERLNIHDRDVQSHFFLKSGLGIDDSSCSRERMQISLYRNIHTDFRCLTDWIKICDGWVSDLNSICSVYYPN